MGNGSKKLYWAGAGAAFLFVLLVAITVIVPRVIDTVWLKEIIQTEVAKQVNGDFGFQKVELVLLPTPSISLKQIDLTIPETVKAKLGVLRVYPKVLPLFLGNIELNRVIIDKPDFSLPLPQRQENKTDKKKGFSLDEVLENRFSETTQILATIQGLEVDIRNGTLRLFADAEPVFLFENINGEYAFGTKSLTITVSSKSNIWESMQLNAKLTPGSQEAKGEIVLKNTNNKDVVDYILPGESPLEAGTFSTLQVNFNVSTESGLTAEIKSSGSSFSALHEDKKIKAEVGSLQASVYHTDEISSVTLDELKFYYPQAQLSGAFTFDRTIPHASLDITSQNANIKSLYEVLPVFIKALYGDQPVIREIFDITRKGTVTEANFHVEGKSLAGLAVFESMHIKGHVKEGEILLSDLGLDLQGVTGDVIIDNGTLEGRNLQAQLGSTTGSNGSLKLGLVKKEITPFHLDLELNADLSEVPPILKQLLPDENIQYHLSLFESLQGTAQGRLTMGDSLEALKVRVEAEKINAQAQYKLIPYNVSVDGGRVVYEDLKIQSHGLQGRLGNSTFSNYSDRTNWEGEPTVEVKSGTFHLVMDEIFPWLKTYEKLAKELENINSISGSTDITVKSIKGQLLKPADLHYDLQGKVKNIALDTTMLPGTLKIKKGQSEIIPDKLTFIDLQADLLDSSLIYSGVIQGFMSGKTKAEVIVTDAEIGTEVNTWLVKEIKAPKHYQFRTPLLISRANAKWTRDELFDLQGDFSIKNGPIFSVDVMLNPDELFLRNLAIKNGEDQAFITLDLEKRKIGAGFKGSLSQNTIGEILLYKEAFPDAWIKGDIRFYIDKDAPTDTTVNGKLAGGDFIIPLNDDKHILLDSYSISASDKTITLNSADAVFKDFNFSMNGAVTLAGERLSVDLDVKTDTIELDEILETFQKEEKSEENAEEEDIVKEALDFSLAADINMKAESLIFNGYTWVPFESKIVVSESYLGFEVLEARLCNISTPGKLSLHEGKIYLDVSMKAADQELSEVLICLEGGEQQMTGILDLNANISGQGAKGTLINSLQGRLLFNAEEGFIYQDAQAAKLLNFLNVTNLFQGKIPDLRTTGFHYDYVFVTGTMKNGVLLISPANLEAPIMEIVSHGTIDIPRKRVDLQVLVAPLQTLNKIQRLVPIISKIIPSSLVAIPVEVSGDFSDIQVRAMSMSAIGTRTLGVLIDALSTPVRVVEDASEETQ